MPISTAQQCSVFDALHIGMRAYRLDDVARLPWQLSALRFVVADPLKQAK